jgi:hypothetical protein
MNKLSIAKSYVKHPFFLGLGSNLLLGATVGLGSSSIMNMAHLGDAPTHLIVALTPIILNVWISAFAHMTELVENENNVLVKFYNPFLKLTKKIVNQYINNQKSHLLDLNNNNESEENIKRVIKHFFFTVFCTKENYGDIRVKSENSVEFNGNIVSNGFYNNGYKQVLNNINTQDKIKSIIEEVFKDFKNEALFANTLKEKEDYFTWNSSFSILFQINRIHCIITEKDTKALKKLFKNSSIRDDIAEQLFLEDNYLTFPKHFREEIIKHISSNYLEKNKVRIFEMEKSLDSTIVDEIKKTQQKNQLEIIQQNIQDNETKNINSNTLETIALKVPKEVKIEIEQSLNNAEYLSQNLSYLSATQHIEFKNLINNILPKYLSLFVEQDIKNENQLHDVIDTLKIINQCLGSFKEEVQLQKSSNLESYQGFIHNKLQHFRDTQSGDKLSENHQTLKSNM